MYLFLGTGVTVIATLIGTAYAQRRKSPTSTATIGGAYDSLLTQLQLRLVALEARVATLEYENDAYHRLYGPLPKENP